MVKERALIRPAVPVEAEEGMPAPVTLGELFWIFFIAAFLGALIETVFCRFSMGYFMSRSGVIYGSFSLVWGLGAAALTVALRPLLLCRDGWLFLAGTLVGGVWEYGCSWFQEVVFGASFWDYSHLPLNINGRVNLVYCLFWGAAALIWMRVLCPCILQWVRKIPAGVRPRLTTALVLFMTANILISALALVRMEQRQQGIPAMGPVAEFLDETYPDRLMERVYPTFHPVGE